VIGTKAALFAGLLILAGLALWWRYGFLVVLAEPSWFCSFRAESAAGSSPTRRNLPITRAFAGRERRSSEDEVSKLAWWQRGIVYEIYPRSFMDANGDGIGDLQGIIDKLDYLTWLGVDALWLTPVFPSPMVDFGYDVSDYTDIDPVFGNLATIDALVREAHARGLRIVLDFVANHTSDRHPWFLESRSSRSSRKRDWYIWRDPEADGGPPNNWMSAFGGSAWEWDATTGQYYYHAFAKEQPDLNWRNPDVRAQMHAVLRFWLDRGIDGFRIDAVARLIEDEHFRDNPPDPEIHPPRRPDLARIPYSRNLPEVHEVLAEFRRLVDAYEDRVLIGETYLPIEDLMAYYGKDLGGVHLPMNFHLMLRPWDADTVAALVQEYEDALPRGAWPNWVLGNHDRPRVATRLGLAQARVAAMLLLTLRGTPLMYYGDEIGMEDGMIPPEQVRDFRAMTTPGNGVGRDAARTPMQWDASAHAGFSTGEPWLPVSPNSSDVNVETEKEDPLSMLTLYRRLIGLRRGNPALTRGDWKPLCVQGGAFVYLRLAGAHRLMIALSMTDEPHAILLERRLRGGRILLSTHLDRREEPVENELDLRADEGVIVELNAP
jgi:alpha-glucosidase